MGCSEHHARRLAGTCLLGCDYAAGGVRVEQISAAPPHFADAVGHLGLAGTCRREVAPHRLERVTELEATRLRERAHPGPHPGSIPTARLEQVALEVGGYLDVHRRRG